MGEMLLNVDKACIDKRLGYEVPDFIYEEALMHAKAKKKLLVNLGYEHVKEPYWLITVTAEYVNRIFNLETYKRIVEG